MTLQFRKIETKKRLLQLLLKYDDSAVRTVSSRVLSLKSYAEKLINFAQNYEICMEDVSVGFFSFYNNDKIQKTAYLTIIAIDSKVKNLGIGSSALWYMEQLCKEKEMQSIKLEVDKRNKKAICFYEKNGFLQTMDASSDSFFMEKEI